MHKKLHLIVLFLFCIIFSTEAQELFEGRKYGISLNAPVFSFISSNDRNIANKGLNLGYGVQAHVEFSLSSYVSLITGLGYSANVGGRIEHEIGGNLLPKATLSNPALNSGIKPLPDGTRIRYKLQMLDIPLGFKFYTPYRNSRQFFAELPVVRVAARLKATGDIQPPGISDTRGETITNETRLMAVSTGAALGVVYDLGRVGMEVALTGNYWLTDMTRNNGIRVIQGEGGVLVPQDILATDRPIQIGLRVGVFF
jgi:hypothetical protein